MMSIRPQASIAVSTRASAAPGAVRSPPWTTVSPAISDAVCSARSASRSLMSTLAPCSESSSAVARPMPRADPVTIATLSSRTPMSWPPDRAGAMPAPNGSCSEAGFCRLSGERRGSGDDAAGVEHDDLVGHARGVVDVAREQHDRDAVLVRHLAQEQQQARALLGIEVGDRLVDQKHARA